VVIVGPVQRADTQVGWSTMASGEGVDRVEREHRPSPIDVHVGGRVRLRRTLLGMSQEKLGEALGLTFQQVQKYERGVNRIGASRLFDLARVLDVPIGFFFDDMPDALGGSMNTVRRAIGFAEQQDGFEDDTLHRRETLELVRAYYRITDTSVRKRVFELIKSLTPTD
jgi:transcriptional regulator with XRE-family HTH domain